MEKERIRGEPQKIIEPGVYNLTLQNALAPLRYYYAPDPARQKVSTLGGNFRETAEGPHGLKYGVTSNHVLGAEVPAGGGRKYTPLPQGDLSRSLPHEPGSRNGETAAGVAQKDPGNDVYRTA